MNKQEQIEEMAQFICGRSTDDVCIIDRTSCDCNCAWARTAEAIYNAGYRKIPENAVVLTKEEYDKLGLFEETVQEYKSDNGQLVLVKEQKKLQKYSTDIADFIRKETAKEILSKLNALMEQYHYKSTAWRNCANFIKERYGLGVEE